MREKKANISMDGESKKNKKTGKVIGTGFMGLLLWLFYFLVCPPLSLAYTEGVLFFGVAIIILISVIVMWSSKKDVMAKFGITFGVGWIILIIIIGIGLLAGIPLFHSETLRSQLGEPSEIEFDEMITQIDLAQIPIVDEELARKQADKKIGEDIALGSRIKLGDAAIQEVNGEILWVIPLEHTGIFKWYKFRSTPGYITVSASNPNKVKYVSEIDGKDIQIKYSNSSYFGNNLKRHIRNEGYRDVGLTEYTFEIDDSGKPYWVVTTYKNKTVWSHGEATGVVIVDAQTGETNFFGINDDIPGWVDIVQPQKFVESQIDNWGKLVHGVLNFSNEDKIKKTDLTLTVYINGDCYYFTGMTSVGSDESCVGFIMVNTRTKKSQICYMTGATETSAMKSAEGLVSDFGYTSTEPLPINVNGIPTYVMALKDAEGLNKNYAMVNIENYNISAKGSTLQEASRAYIQAVSKNSSTYVVGSDEAYGYDYEGIVERISAVVEDGSTYYYLILEGQPNKIFMASYNISDELAITREGDTVKVYYVDDSNGAVDMVSFDNVDFATQISDKQEERNELDKGTSAIKSEKE